MLTFALVALVYSVAFSLILRMRNAEAARAAARAERDRDGYVEDESDGDTLVARSRARLGATSAVYRSQREAAGTRLSSLIVSEATTHRLPLLLALSTTIVVAFLFGGPIPGLLIGVLCLALAAVPLMLRARMNAYADAVLASSGIAADEPLYVPGDWTD